MRRRLPSLNALLCFESSARHLSFTRAGEELALTQSAVSRQIKKLEAFLGCPLFERIKQRLQLTETGRSYAEDIRALLDQAEAATLRITLGQGAPLRVGAEPAIAGRWLIPRLGEFQQSHPGIEIDLVTDMELLYGGSDGRGIDGRSGDTRGYDVAILYGEGHWPGLDARLLMEDTLVAVASPKLLGDAKVVADYSGLLDCPLLHHTAPLSSSQAWLRAAGLTDKQIDQLPGQRLENFQLLLQAALQGMGVAILPHYFARDELSDGRLVQACDQVLTCPQSYFVVVPQEMREQPAVNHFADWLIAQGTV